MSALLLAGLFAAGVALIWLGTVCHITIESASWRLLSRHGRTLLVPAVAAAGTGLVAFELTTVPILALAAAAAAGSLRPPGSGDDAPPPRSSGNAPGRPRSPSSQTRSRPGSPSPPQSASPPRTGPPPLRPELARFHARLRAAGLEAALDGLADGGERSADTVALLLRAGLLELPAGGLAAVLRELATVLDRAVRSARESPLPRLQPPARSGDPRAQPDPAAPARRTRRPRLPRRLQHPAGTARRRQRRPA